MEQMQPEQTIENNGPLYWQPDPRAMYGTVPMYPEAQTKEAPRSTGDPSESFDRPFNPSAAGFVTGIACGVASAAFFYFFSGAYRMVSHSQEERRILARERMELFGRTSSKKPNEPPRKATFDERRLWFERIARSYASFAAGSHAYLAVVLPNIERAALVEGKDGRDRMDELICACAAELQKLALFGGLDWMRGQAAWKIVYRYLEQMDGLADEVRNVPLEIKERVEKRVAGLRKTGSRIGKREIRALEQEEMAKAGLAT